MSTFELIRTEAADHSVKRMCRLLEVSRSGYYDHLVRRSEPPPVRDERVLALIRSIHAVCEGAYGVRRMHRELLGAGEKVSRKRVRRLMRQHGIRAVQTPRFCKTTDSNHDLGFAPNLLAGYGDGDRAGRRIVITQIGASRSERSDAGLGSISAVVVLPLPS